jgi:hypothetical protein
MGSENVHGCTQNVENGFTLTFLEQCYKDSDEFLNHIIQVTGDETWVSLVNDETCGMSNVRDTHALQQMFSVAINTDTRREARWVSFHPASSCGHCEGPVCVTTDDVELK